MAKYGLIFFTFAVSGVLHTLSDISLGVPRAESGAIRWFCMQALGIVFEDGVQALWKTVSGNRVGEPRSVPRMLGYIWVAAWWVWSSPVWVYPIMQRDKGAHIIPF